MPIEGDIITKKLDSLEERLVSLEHLFSGIEKNVHITELHSAQIISEIKIELNDLKNQIEILANKLRCEMNALVTPILINTSVLQTKQAVVGAVIGALASAFTAFVVYSLKEFFF